ncbi:hypothetical protein ACUOBA_25680, partial [Escherichia coli]
MADNKPELQRGLEARHIELIALGGTIGVGLFMGAASTLKWAGPSVLLAYITPRPMTIITIIVVTLIIANQNSISP